MDRTSDGRDRRTSARRRRWRKTEEKCDEHREARGEALAAIMAAVEAVVVRLPRRQAHQVLDDAVLRINALADELTARKTPRGGSEVSRNSGF